MRIMVLAMGRSGHHSLVDWIGNNLPGDVVVGNNCIKGWNEKKHIPKKIRMFKNKGAGIHEIMSIEDFYLPLWDKYKMGEWNKFDKIVVVIRSYRNWLASSIAAGGWANVFLDKAPEGEVELPVSRIEAYKEYQEKFSNYYGAVCGNLSECGVSYDLWCDSKSDIDDYRERIAENIGFKMVNREQKHCKWSSFGNNHDYTSDRYKLLDKKQKERFDSVYPLLEE